MAAAPLPALPSLDPLDELSSHLDAIEGAAGVLASALESPESIGTDQPRAAHAIAHAIEAVKARLDRLHDELLAYRAALARP